MAGTRIRFPTPTYGRNTNQVSYAYLWPEHEYSIRLWDVKTGQQKAKLDGHSSIVTSVNFSPDGTTLASGSSDNSIRLWDVKTRQQIQQSDNRYKDILAQFQPSMLKNNVLPESVNSNVTILLISQQLIFQSQGALILKGQFLDYKEYDLRSLFKSKGSLILENSLMEQLFDTFFDYM